MTASGPSGGSCSRKCGSSGAAEADADADTEAEADGGGVVRATTTGFAGEPHAANGNAIAVHPSDQTSALESLI